MQDVFQEKFAFFFSCLALSIKHQDLTFHPRVSRSSADHTAHCLLLCLRSVSCSGPLRASGGERAFLARGNISRSDLIPNEGRAL